MKRNWCAVFIVIILGIVLYSSELYLIHSTQQLTAYIEKGESFAAAQQYAEAKKQFESAIRYAERKTGLWNVFIRRTILEHINETLAILPAYANIENASDLNAEIERAMIQIKQLQDAFCSIF